MMDNQKDRILHNYTHYYHNFVEKRVVQSQTTVPTACS